MKHGNDAHYSLFCIEQGDNLKVSAVRQIERQQNNHLWQHVLKDLGVGVV